MFDFHMHSRVSFDGHDTGRAMAQAALDAAVNSAAAVIQGWMECYSADMGGIPVDAGWFSLPADFLF